MRGDLRLYKYLVDNQSYPVHWKQKETLFWICDNELAVASQRDIGTGCPLKSRRQQGGSLAISSTFLCKYEERSSAEAVNKLSDAIQRMHSE